MLFHYFGHYSIALVIVSLWLNPSEVLEGGASHGWKCLPPSSQLFTLHWTLLVRLWRWGRRAQMGRGRGEKGAVCLGCVWKLCFPSTLGEVNPVHVPTSSSQAWSVQPEPARSRFGSCPAVHGDLRGCPQGDEWVMGVELCVYSESKSLLLNNVLSSWSLINHLRLNLCPKTGLARCDLQEKKSSPHSLWQMVCYSTCNRGHSLGASRGDNCKW